MAGLEAMVRWNRHSVVRLFLGVLLASALYPGTSLAETFNEALAAAYEGNPTLLSQRAQLRATDERLPEARSGWRPTVTANGEAGVASVDSSGGGQQDLNPIYYGLSVNQPLYRGGRTSAATSRARNLIFAERERLRSTEQSVLLSAAIAYLDVLRDNAVLELNSRNEQVLRRELNATEDRFRVGELTLTDVAQAKARLAGAVAGRIQAQGNLEATRASYVRVIGRSPGTLDEPQQLQGLPTTLEEALAGMAESNPDIQGARFAEQAAQDEIRLVKGEMLPSLSLNGSVSHSEESSSPGSEVDSSRLVAQLNVPLYQAGAVSARVRQAKQSASQRRIQMSESERAATATMTAAWERLAVARARVTQFEAQVEANNTALQGTREQAKAGVRILLDVLNAEQELLDAKVSLVVAKRDTYVAGLEVLSSVGRLTARDLGLPVEYYDETAYFDRVKGKIWGTEIGDSQ